MDQPRRPPPLLFDLIAGTVILGIVLAVLLGGIAASGRLQDRLEAEQGRRNVIPGRFSRHDLDQAIATVVRTRTDERQAA